MGIALTAELVEVFAGVFLSARYDDARPTPEFHRAAWALYCSPIKQAMVIAPRDHAKSTALTFDFILAAVCWRINDYVILIGSTEEKAAEQLSNIREELASNEALRIEFGVSHFETEQKTEIIVVHDDGYRFRILARGAEQKIRGAMWKGKRPNLIVCDDMEDDEQVESPDRRKKFRKWFFRAAKQALSKKGKIRVHGTILHEDSLLSRLRKNKVWHHLFYKAHKSYNDFSDLLWPERWTEADLRERQLEFEQDFDADGYSQEFLNTPGDNNEKFLRKQDFLPMRPEDHDIEKIFAVGVDLAISKTAAANCTSFTVGGRDVNNLIHVVDEHVGKWDSLQLIEKFFEVKVRWHPAYFFVENERTWMTLSTILYNEMRKRDDWFIVVAMTPLTNKATRASAFQKRHRAGTMRFDKTCDWYPGYESELLKFTALSDALADDQFDSTALLCKGFEEGTEVEVEDHMTDDELEEEFESRRLRSHSMSGGRNSVTGY